MNEKDLLPYIRRLRQGIRIDQKRFEKDIKAWERFKIFIDENIDEVLKINLRWLKSIIDSYVDYGNEIECRNALCIATYFDMIRLADSYFTNFVVKEVTEPYFQKRLYDGINTIHLDKEDTFNNFFYRFDELLEPTPILQKLFEEIKKRFAEHSQLMTFANHRKDFYDKVFYPGRHSFKSIKDRKK